MVIWNRTLIEKALIELNASRSYDRAARVVSEQVGKHVTAEQLRSALRRRNDGQSPMEHTKELFDYIGVPEPEPVSFQPPIHVTSQGALVLADLHVPYHHQEFLTKALDVGGAWAVSDVYIIGDLFNFDSLSQHPANEHRVSVERDFEGVGKVLQAIASRPNVLRIFVCNGNHDERLAKSAGANILLKHLVAAAMAQYRIEAKVYVTEYDFLYHNERWLVGHLSHYSRRPGERAKKIAEKFRRNVAVGHDHIQGFTSTADGKFLAISIGAMFGETSFSATPFWYKERRLSDFPEPQRGFLVLHKDVPYLFNEYGLSVLNGGASWDELGY